MSNDLTEAMHELYNFNMDEVDVLVQNIVKIEKSFKNRGSSKSTRRNQIEGEIQNFADNHQKKEE